MRKYALGPFIVESPIPFPELPEAALEQEASVSIRIGKVPEVLQNPLVSANCGAAARDEYLLNVEGVAKFWVHQGREVVIEPAVGAVPIDIRAYFLAPIFATLCRQTGKFALHASSIRFAKGIVAFLGPSGAGKSTLAAYFARRGYPVTSDDICLLELSHEDVAHVVPVAPAIKLWRNSLEQLGGFPETLTRVSSQAEKFRIPIEQVQERLPLRDLLFLEWGDDCDTAVRLAPLGTLSAIAKMMEHTHQEYLVRATNLQKEHFEICGKTLAGARAGTLRRPRDFQRLSEVADAVEAYLASR